MHRLGSFTENELIIRKDFVIGMQAFRSSFMFIYFFPTLISSF